MAEVNCSGSALSATFFILFCTRLTMDWTELFLDRDDQSRLTLSDRHARNTYITVVLHCASI